MSWWQWISLGVGATPDTAAYGYPHVRRGANPIGAARPHLDTEGMSTASRETLRARAGAWARLSAAYSNGDHYGVSGQDAIRALGSPRASRASERSR